MKFLLIVYKGPLWEALTAGKDALEVEEGAWWSAPNTLQTSLSTNVVIWGALPLLKDEPFWPIAADKSPILPRICLSILPAERHVVYTTWWILARRRPLPSTFSTPELFSFAHDGRREELWGTLDQALSLFVVGWNKESASDWSICDAVKFERALRRSSRPLGNSMSVFYANHRSCTQS